MAQHLIHGFNVIDGGRGSIGKLARWLPEPVPHSYGWVFLLRLRWVNDSTVRQMLPTIKPGDVLIAHSNGALIAWRLVMAGAPVSAVVCIQPALRRDTRWPETLPVLCLHNPGDLVVEMGRVWGRFASVSQPWRERHGWGSAGRHGFTSGQPMVEHWDTSKSRYPVKRHSGVFKEPALSHWAPWIAQWLKSGVAG